VNSGHLIYSVSLDVDPEVEPDFNDWYTNVHLPVVVACPGFVSGKRYTARTVGKDAAPVARYWALYEIESEEALTSPELQSLRGEGFGRFTDHVRDVRRMVFSPLAG
jgi:hypothetical protein